MSASVGNLMRIRDRTIPIRSSVPSSVMAVAVRSLTFSIFPKVSEIGRNSGNRSTITSSSNVNLYGTIVSNSSKTRMTSNVQQQNREVHQQQQQKQLQQQQREAHFKRLINEDDEVRSAFVYCLAFAQDSDTDFQRNYELLFPRLSGNTNEEVDSDSIRQMQQRQIANSHKKLLHETVAAATTAATTSDRHSHQGTLDSCKIRGSRIPSILPSTTSENAKDFRYDSMPLPVSVADISSRQNQNRAIVVTESTPPYRIVDVNRCWVELCGYTLAEAKNQTLGSLLHGPETNTIAATALITNLLTSSAYNNMYYQQQQTVTSYCSDVGTILINYKKDGTKFKNRIRVGPLYETSGFSSTATSSTSKTNKYNTGGFLQNHSYALQQPQIGLHPQYFVGVLQEIP